MSADSRTVEDIDLPLKVGRTRIGSQENDDDGDDGTEADSTIFSDLADLRKRATNDSRVSVSARSPTATDPATPASPPAHAVSELDAGSPAVAEVEGDKPPAVELAGNGTGGVAELDASQTFVELPAEFERKVDLAAGAGGVERRVDYGV